MPDPTLDALARAAAALARLDQALAGHPLRPAFLYRSRLEAVRGQAAADGMLIDPWHLAAMLEGLRLRMDGALRIIDRGALFAAARHALDLHQWLTAPDFDQEGEIRAAQAALAGHDATPLLAAAQGLHAWLGQGRGRAPMRAALVRFWMQRGLVRAPVPLTGAAALRGDGDWEPAAWVPGFLRALAAETADALGLLATMERAWLAARATVADRRTTSRAARAIDLLAAAPALSASTLARRLGMAVNNATALLDGFCAAGIAVEVSHRAKRRLFGLAGLAPLRDGTAAPRRPEPGRGRGRPPIPAADAPAPDTPPLPPVSPLERRAFDYGDLEADLAHLERVLRQTRRALDAHRRPT